MKVAEVAREAPWVTPATKVYEAARLMEESEVPCVMVKTVDGEFVGIFCRRELVSAASENNCHDVIEDYVNTEPSFVSYDADVIDAIKLFNKYKEEELVVLNENEEPYAVITTIDVVRIAGKILESIYGD
ncbi:CBS domain-containing protein [Ignicoccus hospitalis]|uniref:Putative signal transduction protein with CBS domains n=1 Tax=Ignicoccus hospitalis (strain KIN4/I / DSM 18386 / JCM 14125) TaxID=453591 RepID=A8A9M5_IGNH4|nr:CBS domain-containing protein [Ignicoccus hospitalis]ABU81627.1 putative signal transduction protein with CBS domains [Ignicoccus hospitalis KIN4/I]HIH89743.1 CBS domain-containing protein [Desulfurococcaceae archaeon]